VGSRAVSTARWARAGEPGGVIPADTVDRVVVGRFRVKKLVTIALVAGAAVLLRRQRDARPAKDVWRDATRETTSS
jgi:hypothetical protein